MKTFLLWLNENEFIQNVGKLKLIKAEIANIVPLSDVEVKYFSIILITHTLVFAIN